MSSLVKTPVSMLRYYNTQDDAVVCWMIFFSILITDTITPAGVVTDNASPIYYAWQV